MTQSTDASPGQHGQEAVGADGQRRPAVTSLPDRLNALAKVVQIGEARTGRDGFGREVLDEASALLARAGERRLLSGLHTVVSIAGGTGSGKSSLFNALAGVEFSPAGVKRPTTGEAHACVWGMAGAGPLLDWLGIQRRHRYARSSALARGEVSLYGLILLDLPDHDSAVGGGSHEVDRLVRLADMMIWVLDPQKYADAAVHSRYLAGLGSHSAVITVLLNQADLLTAEQAQDCLGDLRRLLESEGLHDARVLLTSATTGGGIDELRKVLVEAVTDRHAAIERVEADADAVVARLERYARPAEAAVPERAAAGLTEAFAQSAGMTAATEALRGARERSAAGDTGWPVAALAARLAGRGQQRKTRIWDIAGPPGGLPAITGDAQPAEIDNAITTLAGQVSASLPPPWSHTVSDAARSRADTIPGALGAAVADALPAQPPRPPWWRLVPAWQWLLIAGVAAGFGWVAAILAFAQFHADRHVTSPLLDRLSALPLAGAAIVVLLLAGWLTAAGCRRAAVRAAEAEQAGVIEDMRSRVAGVARDLVLVPVDLELAEYDRFRDQLRIARGRAFR